MQRYLEEHNVKYHLQMPTMLHSSYAERDIRAGKKRADMINGTCSTSIQYFKNLHNRKNQQCSLYLQPLAGWQNGFYQRISVNPFYASKSVPR